MSKALIQKIISASEPKYVRHLKNPHTVFNNTIVKVSLKHLYGTCGTVIEYNSDSNNKNMKTPWNKYKSLENVLHQIENDVLFAEIGVAPISNT